MMRNDEKNYLENFVFLDHLHTILLSQFLKNELPKEKAKSQSQNLRFLALNIYIPFPVSKK